MCGPDGVIVRVFGQVRAQLWPRHAATAARGVHARLVHVSKHVVVHQVSALPGWLDQAQVMVVMQTKGGGNGRRRGDNAGWVGLYTQRMAKQRWMQEEEMKEIIKGLKKKTQGKLREIPKRNGKETEREETVRKISSEHEC